MHYLENALKARCPDFNLNDGPGINTVAGNASPELQRSDFVDSDDWVDATNFDKNLGIRNSSFADSTVNTQTSGIFRTQSYPSGRTIDPVSNMRPPEPQFDGPAHEIGLVSLNGFQDPRYIGPSSGYFLARMLLTTSSRNACDEQIKNDKTLAELAFPSSPRALPGEFMEAFQGPLHAPPESQAVVICNMYFETLHTQYPILHRPTFFAKLSSVLVESSPKPEDAFQVFMVLAIGSIVTSHRRHIHLPAESYCLSALQYLEQINVENSLQGLQCLILLHIFTNHCSSMKLNMWYLNYHCIAAALDLGIQRNVTIKSGISLLEQEMRTRVFWTVLMIDRRVATMMGRPVGLRDEACDLRVRVSSTICLMCSTDSFFRIAFSSFHRI